MEINSKEFFEFITNAINQSGKSDGQIANECDIGRVAIWKIRNNKTKTIRRDTLRKISNSLGLSYSFSGKDIEFNIDTTKPIGGGIMANTTADKVIDHLMLENKRANETILEMKKVVDTLREDLRFKDELLTKNHVIRPSLDQSRMQCLVSIKDNGKYLDITTLYSKFLGYEPYELLGEEFRNHIDPDEYERIEMIEKNPERSNETEVWKVLHKDGTVLYIKAFGKVIETPTGVISVVDCTAITEDDYNDEISDTYYTESVKGES